MTIRIIQLGSPRHPEEGLRIGTVRRPPRGVPKAEYAARDRDELQQLPAIGPSMAADLRRLGVRSVKDLARRDPERLYARLCELTGARQDPCVLYTFRCAVYAARTPRPKSELLNWWAWKGRTLKGA